MNNFKTYRTISFIFGTIIILLLSTSCYKETYPKYILGPEQVDTTKWDSKYENLGTIPGPVVPVVTHNVIYNTKWVLTKYITGFGTQQPNDTITFISDTRYKVNSQSSEHEYTINSLVGSTNYSLMLAFFSPFGGSHYSGQVGQNFVADGVMNNVIFTDFYGNATIKAWFKKI
jgi:hypothetical protein